MLSAVNQVATRFTAHSAAPTPVKNAPEKLVEPLWIDNTTIIQPHKCSSAFDVQAYFAFLETNPTRLN